MDSKSLEALLKDDKKFTEAAKEEFSYADKNGSGDIDLKELDKIMLRFTKRCHLDRLTESEIKQVFEEQDINKSGKLEFNEFKSLLKSSTNFNRILKIKR